MGYMLSSLGNLPVQEDVSLYIFVVNGRWSGEFNDLIEKNFGALAEHIGPNSVIAKGFDPEVWSNQVCSKYLGKDTKTMLDVLPALLLTDAHPEKLTDSSLRLLVPLRDADKRFGGIETFFAALADFSKSRNPDFLARFEDKEPLKSKAWSVLELKPNLFGFGINLKELAARVQGK
jgi:hypothetical protein